MILITDSHILQNSLLTMSVITRPSTDKAASIDNHQRFGKFFTFQCHMSLGWPSRDFFHPSLDLAKIAFWSQRFSSLRRKWSSQCIHFWRILSSNLFSASSAWKICWCRSSLLTFCCHYIISTFRKHVVKNHCPIKTKFFNQKGEFDESHCCVLGLSSTERHPFFTRDIAD